MKGDPDAWIKIYNPEDVGKCLSLANEFCVPVTCRGSGSSLTGGVYPFQRWMGFGFVFAECHRIDKP